MSSLRTICVISIVGLTAAATHAGPFTFSFHEATGEGTALLFDGGPPVMDSDTTTGPNDPEMFFQALDETPGTLPTYALGWGASRMLPAPDDELNLEAFVEAEYFLAPIPVNPGGTADASLNSVFEFVMPSDHLLWSYSLDIDLFGASSGSNSIIFENVSESTTLLELTMQTDPVNTILSGSAGDVIRMTSMMSGTTESPVGGIGSHYTSRLQTNFAIPEPATFTLLLLASPVLARRSARRQ